MEHRGGLGARDFEYTNNLRSQVSQIISTKSKEDDKAFYNLKAAANLANNKSLQEF